MISLLAERGFTELSVVHRGESGVVVLEGPALLNETEEFVTVNQFRNKLNFGEERDMIVLPN